MVADAYAVGEDAAAEPLPGLYRSFNWSNERLWSLSLPTIEIATVEIAWHLRVTIWSTVLGRRLFDLRPMTVIQRPDLYRWHIERIRAAPVEFPIDTVKYDGRDVILDGVHRLARLWIEESSRVRIRRVPPELLHVIQSDDCPDD